MNEGVDMDEEDCGDGVLRRRRTSETGSGFLSSSVEEEEKEIGVRGYGLV